MPTTFKAVKPADETLAPQAVQIVNLLNEHGSMSRDQLTARLGERITSKQPAGRIFSFYRGALVKGGFIQENEEGVADVPAPQHAPDDNMRRAIAELTVKLVAKNPRFPDGTFKLSVTRGFRLEDDENQYLLICGDEEDHDIWLVNSETSTAVLIGTLPAETCKDAFKRKTVTLRQDMLEYCDSGLKEKLDGHHVNAVTLGSLADKTFTAEHRFERETAS